MMQSYCFYVPVTMFGVSGNYASTLYIAAVKENALDKVESELPTFVEVSKKSPTFAQFMKDASVTSDTRVKAISDMCSQAKLSGITNNFMEEEKELIETLHYILRQGKNIKVDQKIDLSILGGFVMEFGEKVFNMMSIRTRAHQMELFLRQPINLEAL